MKPTDADLVLKKLAGRKGKVKIAGADGRGARKETRARGRGYFRKSSSRGR
jgi:hypothetical protein